MQQTALRTSPTELEVVSYGCDYRFYRQYVLRNMPKTPISKFAALGVAIHATYEQMYKFALFKDSKYLIRLYTKNFDEEIVRTKYEKLEPEEIQSFKDFGQRNLVNGYNTLKSYGLLIQPLITEEKFEFRIPGLKNYLQLNGYIDAVFEIGDKYKVIDYKTGKDLPSPIEVRNNIQMTCYSYIVKKIYNKNCDVGMVYTYHRKILDASRREVDYEKITKYAKRVVNLNKFQGKAEELPIVASDAACKYCPLNQDCDERKKAGIKVYTPKPKPPR